MLAHIESNGHTVRLDEHQAIISRCKQALLEAVRDATLDCDELPYAPPGWSYRWAAQGRDRLGNLLVEITCFGPDKRVWRVQKVRLVKEQRLPRELR